jgi:hypothetical protein
MTVIASEVWRYVTICGGRRGTAEGRNGVKFDGSSVVLLCWIVLYCVDMWSLLKECSWKQGKILQTVAQSKIQNKLVWTAVGNKNLSLLLMEG